MGIWVRSQWGELLLCTGFEIYKILFLKEIGIRGLISDGRVTIGTYKSGTRALEVLDEIQRHITFHEHDIACATTGEVYGDSYTDAVYEMPEE